MSRNDKQNSNDSTPSESDYESNDDFEGQDEPKPQQLQPLSSYEKLLIEQKEKEAAYRREPTNYGIKPSLYTNLSIK